MGSLRVGIGVSSLDIVKRRINGLIKISMERLVQIICMVLFGLKSLNWIKSTTIYLILGSCATMIS